MPTPFSEHGPGFHPRYRWRRPGPDVSERAFSRRDPRNLESRRENQGPRRFCLLSQRRLPVTCILMPEKMKCQKRFLKSRHRNPFLRILLASGDNGIFTTLHVEQRQIHFYLAVHDLHRRTRNGNLRQPAIVDI